MLVLSGTNRAVFHQSLVFFLNHTDLMKMLYNTNSAFSVYS